MTDNDAVPSDRPAAPTSKRKSQGRAGTGKARDASGQLRLHVYLARAGIGSRRAMESAIAAGRVTVNGGVVTKIGAKVDPAIDRVTLDGAPVRGAAFEPVYVAIHKPKGVLTTVHDERGRKTVLDLLPAGLRVRRLYPVGRLDLDSEGLVLMTNHGELAQLLTHPRFGHEKEYEVTVSGRPSEATLAALRAGVNLEDGATAPAAFEPLRSDESSTVLRAVMKEGRKRQIRRMFEAKGHRVERLLRVRIGPLKLGALKPGGARRLSRQEVAELKALLARNAESS